MKNDTTVDPSEQTSFFTDEVVATVEADDQGAPPSSKYFSALPLRRGSIFTALFLQGPVKVLVHALWADRHQDFYLCTMEACPLCQAKDVAADYLMAPVYLPDEDKGGLLMIPAQDTRAMRVKEGLRDFMAATKFKAPDEVYRMPFEIICKQIDEFANALSIEPEVNPTTGDVFVFNKHDAEMVAAQEHREGMPTGSFLRPFNLELDGRVHSKIAKKLTRLGFSENSDAK